MLRFRLIVLTCTCLAAVPIAVGQSLPTATVGIFPSVFAGVTGTETGFNQGRNLAVTAGVDIGFYSARRFDYALEYRGTYALDKGSIDSQKSNLAGINLSRNNGRIRPYGDLFAGRAEIVYAGAGAQVQGTPIFYTRSSTSAFAVGGGAYVDLGPRFALKVDALFQRYSSPVATSGHIYPTSATLGIVYRIRPRRLTGAAAAYGSHPR